MRLFLAIRQVIEKLESFVGFFVRFGEDGTHDDVIVELVVIKGMVGVSKIIELIQKFLIVLREFFAALEPFV